MNQEQRDELLKMYDGLRVTDVNDGMDAIGLQNVGIMDKKINTLWRDIDEFKHRIYGFALTIRFMPTNQAIHASSLEEYKKIKGSWYKNLAASGHEDQIRKGDLIVIDCPTSTDIGFLGSENTYGWITKGASGVVTNGGCRDTDELIKEQVPVYSAYIGRGIRPGRIEFDCKDIPINVGGVLVRPGDMVVADGDGVVVVPIEHAKLVAEIAHEIQEGDKLSRLKHYEAAGREIDFTVLPKE